MKETKEIKVKLSTAILLFSIIIVLIGGIIFLCVKNSRNKKDRLLHEKYDNFLSLHEELDDEDDEFEEDVSNRNNSNEKQDNKENLSEADVKENETLKKLADTEELEDFLEYIGDLSSENSQEKTDSLTNKKIMIAAMHTNANHTDNGLVYNIQEIKDAFQEIFNEKIDIESFIKNGKCDIGYDEKNKKYYALGGDAEYTAYLIKIEKQATSNDTEEITFVYSFPSEEDFLEDRELESDCYRTTVKVKTNKNYKYSKYQLVSSNLSRQLAGKIKDFSDAKDNIEDDDE